MKINHSQPTHTCWPLYTVLTGGNWKCCWLYVAGGSATCCCKKKIMIEKISNQWQCFMETGPGYKDRRASCLFWIMVFHEHMRWRKIKKKPNTDLDHIIAIFSEHISYGEQCFVLTGLSPFLGTKLLWCIGLAFIRAYKKTLKNENQWSVMRVYVFKSQGKTVTWYAIIYWL